MFYFVLFSCIWKYLLSRIEYCKGLLHSKPSEETTSQPSIDAVCTSLLHAPFLNVLGMKLAAHPCELRCVLCPRSQLNHFLKLV